MFTRNKNMSNLELKVYLLSHKGCKIFDQTFRVHIVGDFLFRCNIAEPSKRF